jgi:hypothetical protein
MLACERAGGHARTQPKAATTHIILFFTIGTLFLGF